MNFSFKFFLFKLNINIILCLLFQGNKNSKSILFGISIAICVDSVKLFNLYGKEMSVLATQDLVICI